MRRRSTRRRWRNWRSIGSGSRSGKLADPALMEIGRIWQDGLGDPPIRAIDTFELVLKSIRPRTIKPEAMYRLAKLYDSIKEYAQGVADLQRNCSRSFRRTSGRTRRRLRARRFSTNRCRSTMRRRRSIRGCRRIIRTVRSLGRPGAKRRRHGGEQAAQEGEKYGKSRYGSDSLRHDPRQAVASVGDVRAVRGRETRCEEL